MTSFDPERAVAAAGGQLSAAASVRAEVAGSMTGAPVVAAVKSDLTRFSQASLA